VRLTTFSDYALRLLLYVASAGDRLVTIEETANIYGISRAHLMKVANLLTRAGFLKPVRGRFGGLALGKHPQDIVLGEVVRLAEPDFALVECFGADNRCIITPHCGLPGILNEALNAFIQTFDRYTLADIALTQLDFAPPFLKKQATRGPRIDRPEERKDPGGG
jgi:Rrf2 family transcriptional regulator, nitric oxide-sensitive transcriptional repressor